MTSFFGRWQEDYLDWLENALRPPADMLAVDCLLFAAYIGFSLVLIASVWMARR